MIHGKLTGGRVRAARCEEYGGPGNVVVRDIPDPVVTSGHVVVDVAAAAVNFPDLLFIANRYQVPAPLPFTPGSEFAGRVAGVGAGVTGLAAGDLVYGSTFTGAMAEKVLVKASAVAPVPPGLSLVEAAAFRVTYLTAYHALVTAGGLRPGQWVVVLGAAGGVGSASVDVAVRLGARVIAAASSPERLAVCEKLGAEAGIDYASEDLKQRIREITGDGADVVVDPVGDRWAEPGVAGDPVGRAVRDGGVRRRGHSPHPAQRRPAQEHHRPGTRAANVDRAADRGDGKRHGGADATGRAGHAARRLGSARA